MLFAVIFFALVSIVVGGAFFYDHRRLSAEIRSRERENAALRKSGSEFVANVSHELKTPLTSIKGYSETLRILIQKDPVKALDFLTRLDENAERLRVLIQDILDLSKIEAPNFHHQLKVFKVEPLLLELREQFALKLATNKQTLLVRSEVENLNADERMFEHALSNLIENAIRYSGAGAIIEITGTILSESGRMWAEFEVSDNGPGINVEDLPNIFERFYRADKSRNRQSGGSGLGLAIVKHIMLSHGGIVKVQSEPQKGAAFSLLFPL